MGIIEGSSLDREIDVKNSAAFFGVQLQAGDVFEKICGATICGDGPKVHKDAVAVETYAWRQHAGDRQRRADEA